MRQMLSKMPVGLFVVLWVISCSAVELCAATQYTTTDLGELVTADVNDAAHVLGQFRGRPAVWKDGTVMVMQALGNNRGQPRRWSEPGNGVSVGSIFYPSTGYQGAAQWDASGVLTVLAQNPAHGSIAVAQNAAGVTVGVHGRFDAAYGGPVQSAARWDTPQTLTILDTRDGQWSNGVGVDGQGNVWGYDEQYQTVYWDRQGVKRLIPGQPGLWTGFDAVSESGIAIGTASNRLPTGEFETKPIQATLAQGFSVLPQLDGTSCQPIDINRSGTILGTCYMAATNTYIPVLWEHGAITRLALSVPSDVEGFHVTGLSDSGLLVGHGFTRVGDPGGPPQGFLTHGFLFTPVLSPPSLAIRLNQSTFQPSQTLRVTLDLSNPGPILTTDVYVGVILPDGQTILWLTNTAPLEGVVTSFTQASDPRTFVRLLRNVSWPAGMRATQQDYFTHTFSGLEPLGTYHFLVGWTKPNSLEDGRIDEGDVLALAWAPFTFTPGSTEALYATMRAIQAKHGK
jgi:hypothetical protein